MGKKLAGFMVAFSLCMSLLTTAGYSYAAAADGSVRVTLPDFAVSLNGHSVESQYREYPLLVYHDITYFPMTWYDSRLLGLEATWSQDDGLDIKSSPVTTSYVTYTSEKRNATAYTAEIPSTVVTINGKSIDNKKEEYPLLSFRDVTYFPLTWRFAHNEFGWDYQWSDTDGLSISSHNPQVQTAMLPTSAGENDVALFKGYYYFVETTGMTNHIYRAPVQNPSDKEEIYSYNFYSSDRNPKVVTFQNRDNTLWFTYHLGGGFTGQDYYVKISDDGKAELLHRGYIDFLDTPYGTLILNLPGGYMYLSQPGQDETNSKIVGGGDPNVKMYANQVPRSVPSTAASVVGDDLYVLCLRGPANQNSLCKINLKTNKSDTIVNSSISSFRMINNKLYYVKDEDNALYSSVLDGTGEMKLSHHAVSWFDSIDGNVFYTTKKETNQYDLYKADPNGEDPLVWTTPVIEVQVLKDRLICRFGENDDYGVVLLDSSGHLTLKLTDPISRVLTSDDGILLETARDSSIEYIR
ncbi:DUF5050 domain-containing protein [Paenibacillus sp. MBLB4367]|uniref:DUF5050 domain-containing protein n=1 Tax=Paenibacillus sp. MBLB4367 TaxID=3384767 RepID=UPI0039080F91